MTTLFQDNTGKDLLQEEDSLLLMTSSHPNGDIGSKSFTLGFKSKWQSQMLNYLEFCIILP